MLLYLVADRFLPKSDRVRGAPLPGHKAFVPTTDLTRTLLASTIWNLREQGLVHLETVATTNLLFMKGRQVQVTLVHRPMNKGGLEGDFLAILRDQQPESVKSIVRRWFVKDRPNAYSHVIHAVVREAAAAGLIDSDEMDSIKVGFVKINAVGLGPKGQLQTDQVAAVESACTATMDRWNAFRGNEPDLYRALMDECGKAIKSRQMRSSYIQ